MESSACGTRRGTRLNGGAGLSDYQFKSIATLISVMTPSAPRCPVTSDFGTRNPVVRCDRKSGQSGSGRMRSSNPVAKTSAIAGSSTRRKSPEEGSPFGPRSLPSCESRSSKNVALTRTVRRFTVLVRPFLPMRCGIGWLCVLSEGVSMVRLKFLCLRRRQRFVGVVLAGGP